MITIIPTSGSVDLAKLVANLSGNGHDDIYREIHDIVDRQMLREVLRQVDGNQVAASKLLGISRTTLRNKLEALGLDHAGGSLRDWQDEVSSQSHSEADNR